MNKLIHTNNALDYSYRLVKTTDSLLTNQWPPHQPKRTIVRSVFTLLFIFSSLHLTAQHFDFVVAKDGSGDFVSVQQAIDAVPDFRHKQTTIFIKNGVYKEKLILPNTKTNVKMVGENVDSVILTYDDFASKKNIFGEEIGTTGSSSFFIHGDGFTAEHITFENSSGPVGQAVAVRVASDKVSFFNCRFLGFQDTLYTWGYGAASRQYYKDCYIEGTVDFIFGSSTAVFDRCHLYGKKGGYFTAASTPDTSKFGYIFLDCRIDGNAPSNSFYLGRPWRPFAKTVFINSTMSDIIRPKGWDNWGSVEKEKTVFYAEYGSKGAGANASERAAWTHRLTRQQVQEYTIDHIFYGWNPIE